MVKTKPVEDRTEIFEKEEGQKNEKVEISNQAGRKKCKLNLRQKRQTPTLNPLETDAKMKLAEKKEERKRVEYLKKKRHKGRAATNQN